MSYAVNLVLHCLQFMQKDVCGIESAKHAMLMYMDSLRRISGLVDSLCRDGAKMPISPIQTKKLPNAAVLSLLDTLVSTVCSNMDPSVPPNMPKQSS